MADDKLDCAIAPISLPAIFVYRLRLYGVECDNGVSMGHMMTSSNGNPPYWPFMRGIHQSSMDPPERPITQSFAVFFDVRMYKWLSKQLKC